MRTRTRIFSRDSLTLKEKMMPTVEKHKTVMLHAAPPQSPGAKALYPRRVFEFLESRVENKKKEHRGVN